jgi:hypothetical protein
MMIFANVLLSLTLLSDLPVPIRLHANFEGGSIGTIEKLGETSYRCHIKGQQNQEARNRQASWFYFEIDGARGRELTLTMTDYVGEYNGKPGACPMGPDLVPVFSLDGVTWNDVPSVVWDDKTKEAAIKLQADCDTIWLAHVPPYTHNRLKTLISEIDQSPDVLVEVIGKSVQGRDLHMITVTSVNVPDQGKPTIWLQARQHAWEAGTSYVMEGALRFIISNDAQAQSLRDRFIFKFTPMVDPDGSANGEVRFNANRFDVNRHWDEVNLRDKKFLKWMPEIWYHKKAIYQYLESGHTIDLMINLHNTETSEFIDTMANDPKSRDLVTLLNERLVSQTSFRPSRPAGLGVARDSSANVMHAEKGLLILLMEQRISRDPKSGKTPTIEGRRQFGAKLVQVMAQTFRP